MYGIYTSTIQRVDGIYTRCGGNKKVGGDAGKKKAKKLRKVHVRDGRRKRSCRNTNEKGVKTLSVGNPRNDPTSSGAWLCESCRVLFIRDMNAGNNTGEDRTPWTLREWAKGRGVWRGNS